MVDATYSEAALGLTSPQLHAPAAEDRARAFSGSRIAVLCVILTAIAAIPIILHPWPPISDYINHLARMYVIATANSDPDLARFYEVDWQLIPNLMMDLIVPVLGRVMNIYLAGQIYTIGCFAVILSGTVALQSLALQAGWTLVLIALGRFAMERVMRRLEMQGG